MLEQRITVSNRLGLHARAAAKLSHLLGGFRASATIAFGRRSVNAKSILGLMTLAAPFGSELLLTLDGKDEVEALAATVELFARRFDEPE
jgi:phosphocarrier protein